MPLLRRVRLFVLVFACLATVPAFIALGRSGQPAFVVSGGFAAVLGLTGLWVLAYRRQKLDWVTEVFTGAALFTLVHAAGDARTVQGFFFATLMYNGLFGSLPQLLVRLLLVQGAYFSFEPFTHGALSLVGFTTAGVVVWSLGRALENQAGLEVELRAQEVRHRELELAAQIQTALLPKRFDVPGFDVAAVMVPAEDVGGDYYDVLPSAEGLFVGIGDVSGHGLNAGLVMLMVQSVISALVRERPQASPRELVVVLNAVLQDNIQNRMGRVDHVTFSLLKLLGDGSVTFAGAHEDVIVQRSSDGRVETVETPGTWVGATPDISRATVDSKVRLNVGDLLVLHTDGVTEARNVKGEMFGLERVVSRIEGMRGASPQAVVDALRTEVLLWAGTLVDDVTLVAVRYTG